MEVFRWISFAIMLVFGCVAIAKWMFLIVKLVTLDIEKVSSLDTDFCVIAALFSGAFAGLYLIFKNGVHSDGRWIFLVCILLAVPFIARYIRESKHENK